MLRSCLFPSPSHEPPHALILSQISMPVTIYRI